jgi:hypothetical protein
MNALEQNERTIADIVAFTLSDAGDPHVVVGPLCNQRSDGTSARRWYFCISTCDRSRAWRTDSVTMAASPGADPDDIAVMERTRAALIKRPAAYPPRVIHDVDDEIAAVRLCEQLWPGERITVLRQAVEAEYRERGQM